MSDPKNARPRRNYGQGSLGEISPGVWQMRIMVGRDLLTGKPIQPSRRFRGTRAAAEKALQAFRAEIGEQVDRGQASAARTTLNTVIDRHLTASDLAPGTMTAYRSFHKLHIREGIGSTPIVKLRATTLRQYYKLLADERELSASTIWGIYSLISGAITRAQREDNLAFDRFQLVAPKKPVREQKELATNEEMAKIFAAANDLGEDWPLLFRLAYATGMRRGEIVALRWSSLSADGVLDVHDGVVHEKGTLTSTSTKSGESRLVALDKETEDRWNACKLHRIEQLSLVGLRFSENQFVFTSNPEGTRPRRPDRVTKMWVIVRDDLGINENLEFRSTRNWHITVLRDQLGFPLEFISRRVGHGSRNQSSLAMTASYTVTTRETDSRMAEGVAQVLSEIEKLSTLRRSG